MVTHRAEWRNQAARLAMLVGALACLCACGSLTPLDDGDALEPEPGTTPRTSAAADAPAGTPSPESRCDEPSAPRKDPLADWVNVLLVGGRTYSADGTPALERDQLGPVHATVRKRLDGTPLPPGYQLRDGDATLLDAGMRLYAVRGRPPTAGLAACYDGRWRLYVAREE